MKQLVWIVLFVSLGLNLGLGYRVLSGRQATGDPTLRPDLERRGWTTPGSDRAWRRPSSSVLADSSGWANMARHRLDRLAVRLGLAGEQRERFTAVHLAAATEIRRQRLALYEARGHLYRLYTEPEIDRAAVAAAAEEIAVLQGHLDALVADVLFEELSLLDSEQRARYLALMPWEVGSGPEGGRRHGGSRLHRLSPETSQPGRHGRGVCDTVRGRPGGR